MDRDARCRAATRSDRCREAAAGGAGTADLQRVRQVLDRPVTRLVSTDVQGDAVAELPRIGDLVDAGSAGRAVDQSGVERPHAAVAEAAFVVDERRRPTEGEATPLDERAVSAERGGAFRDFRVDADIRPQRAIGSLRARVSGEVGAVAGGVTAHGAVLRTGCTLHMRGTRRSSCSRPGYSPRT